MEEEHKTNMKLKCRIKEQEFDIVQGATFTDNFNETLDSGIICIDQVPLIENLKPYDDVFIWDSSETFNGYYNKGDFIFCNSTVSNNSIYQGTYQSGDTSVDPILSKSSVSLEKIDSRIYIDGFLQNIFVYRFLNFDDETKNHCRYKDNKIRLNIGYKVPGAASGSSSIFELKSTNEFYSEDSENSFYLEDVNEAGFIIPCFYEETTKKIFFFDSFTANSIEYEVTTFTTYTGSFKQQDIVNVQNIEIENVTDNFINTLENKKFSITFLYKGYEVVADANYYEQYSQGNTYSFRIKYKNVYCGWLDFTYADNSLNCSLSVSTTSAYYSELIAYCDEIIISNFKIEQDHCSTLPTKFFKHMLIESFSKNRLNLGNTYNDSKVLYKYQINLFSEIKKLEKIALPNISITQSLKEETKRSCWYYIDQFIKMYSPKYKKVSNEATKEWSYITKYYASDFTNNYIDGKNGIVTNLKDIFEKVTCPEMSLTNPSLKDVLSQIMICKDIIPIIFNDVLYGLDIGKTDLKTFNRDNVNFDVGSMDSNNYATDARREYSNALGQENSCHLIEYLGFRNPNNSFLTLDSLVLETRFPIYKINKLNLCYYKKFTLTKTGQSPITKVFLCKYNIAPLVLQNVVRNSLSTNWQTYYNAGQGTIDYSNLTGSTEEKMNQISKYKLCTVGYDIGSNRISGWGESYEYLRVLWFKEGKTYIENIVELLERVSDVGMEAFKSELKDGDKDFTISFNYGIDNIVSMGDETYVDGSSILVNVANKIKSIFFEMDYDAMYNGTVIHEKEYVDDDDIVTTDNCSSALTVLETDGLFEREKMNRMSNEIFKFTARYDADNCGGKENVNMSKVQELASRDNNFTNATIYMREYSIYDNCIKANYEGTYEYVLKNYFTSVWAKYRTYSLMPYNESVNRAENYRHFIALSKNKQYYETEGLFQQNPGVFSRLFNFLTPTNISEFGVTTNTSQINCGFFYFEEGSDNSGQNWGGYFLSDVNAFACGNSLCFNIVTYDNVSGGNYIENYSSSLTLIGTTPKQEVDYKTTQNWWQMVASRDDAFTSDIGIYVCHLDEKNYYNDKVSTVQEAKANSQKLRELPKLNSSALSYTSNLIGQNFEINKDNKERLDFTFQFDYLSLDKNDIIVSPWVAKLNDMIGFYKKYSEKTRVITNVTNTTPGTFYAFQTKNNQNETETHIVFKISSEDLDIIHEQEQQGVALATIGANFGNSFSVDVFGNKSPTGVKESVKGNTNKIEITKILQANNNLVKINYDLIAYTEKTIAQYIAFIPISKKTLKDTTYHLNQELQLSKEQEKVESGTTYYYYEGIIESDIFETPYDYTIWDTYGVPTVYDTYWATSKKGNADITELNENNSIIREAQIGNYDEYEKFEPTNMVLIKSTNKLEPTLVYDSFKVDSSNNVQLKSGMYIDTPGFNGLTTGHYVSELFDLDESGKTIVVNASKYNNENLNVKSIQYYYKDEKGWLHFVFGVNVDKNSQNQYDDFNIYLSSILKRNMKVYNENHRLIGESVNYQETDNLKPYGEAQYYKEI